MEQRPRRINQSGGSAQHWDCVTAKESPEQKVLELPWMLGLEVRGWAKRGKVVSPGSECRKVLSWFPHFSPEGDLGRSAQGNCLCMKTPEIEASEWRCWPGPAAAWEYHSCWLGGLRPGLQLPSETTGRWLCTSSGVPGGSFPLEDLPGKVFVITYVRPEKITHGVLACMVF